MIQIGLYRGGVMRLDATAWLAGAPVVRRGEHGDEVLEFALRLGEREAFRWYEDLYVYTVKATDQWGEPVFYGRLSDVALTGDGVRMVAPGMWSALNDARFTALYSTVDYGNWSAVQEEDAGVNSYSPDLFQQDNNQRVYVGTTKGTTYDASVGGMRMDIPNGSSTPVKRVSFTAAYNLPADYELTLLAETEDAASSEVVWTVTGAASSAGTAVDETLTSSAMTRLVWYLKTPASDAIAGETGAYYGRMTNVRVRGVSAATVGPADVADAAVSAVNALNNQVQYVSAVTTDSGADLEEAVWEDVPVGDVLAELATYGDTDSPLYEALIEGDGLFVLRARGFNRRTWYVHGVALEAERSLEEMFNRVYVTYRRTDGRVRRTATAASAASVAEHGFTRETVVDNVTSSTTRAEGLRDGVLDELEDPLPRTALRFSHVYTADGVRVAATRVRTNDVVLLRYLAPGEGLLDEVRQGRCVEVGIDLMTGEATAAVESPLPELERFVVQALTRGER